MNHTIAEWTKVKPDAFLDGSIVQARNVIEMLLQDLMEIDQQCRVEHNGMLRYENRFLELIRRTAWRLIGDNIPEPEYFMVWSPDHPDSPIVVMKDLFLNARLPGIPKHLSMKHFTHWAYLPDRPNDKNTL
jgi:hypothetical protein